MNKEKRTRTFNEKEPRTKSQEPRQGNMNKEKRTRTFNEKEPRTKSQEPRQ
jgi:hypothetical protein